MAYQVDNLTNDPQLPSGGTTDIGAGPDPFEPLEVQPQTLATPKGEAWRQFRKGNARYDSFAIVVGLNQVGYLLPEDPNRAFFKVMAVVPATTCEVMIGKRGQISSPGGYGYPIGHTVAPAPVGSLGSEQKFETTDAVHVTLKDSATNPTAGETATVYVWVEYAE